MSEWIKCSERLPDRDQGVVAVLSVDGDILTAWASYWGGARTDFACWSFPHSEDDGTVIAHWTPLPEPPQ